MTLTRAEKVAAAVRSIKDFYALGQKLPKKASHKAAYGQGAVDAEAQRRHMNPDTARKARQFADPDVGFTADEVATLCRLIVEEQAGQDDSKAVFSKTHVIRVLSVPKRRRMSLVRDAIRKAWSTAELEAAIAARFGSRRDGGRHRRIPADALGVLIQTEHLCNTWMRWIVLLVPEPGENKAKQKRVVTPLDRLPAKIRRLVRNTYFAIAELHDAVNDDLEERRPKRAVRHRFRKVGSRDGDRPAAPR